LLDTSTLMTGGSRDRSTWPFHPEQERPARVEIIVILRSMTYRVGPKGQVVIPKVLREQLGIVPGDEIDFSLDDDVLHLRAVRPTSSLRGSFSGIKLTELLETDRRAERDR